MRLMTVLAAALLVGPVFADDKKGDTRAKDEIKNRIAQYLANGKTGVFYSETQDVKDGEILRLFAVGRAPIGNAFGGDAEDIEVAQERAEQAAKAAFVTFLNGKVEVRKTSNNQLILTKDGEGGQVRESGKIIDKRTTEFTETANGMIRGLKVVAVEQKGKDKTYTVVYRWEARAADAIRNVNDKLNRPKDPAKPEKDKPDSSVRGDTKKPSEKPRGKDIPDKKVIIDD